MVVTTPRSTAKEPSVGAISNTSVIPVFKPWIDETEYAASRAALELGWLGMGSYVNQFEEAVRSYLHAEDRFAAAVSTGHAALHLALLVAGVGPGDEVITPSFNNVTDFQAILATGAELVFCDVDDASLCVDIDKAELLVTPRTKAIIVTDYGCVLCEHTRVAEFARKHRLRVIHDAAHAFGSSYQGRMIGSFSDICMFSFDPVKTLTCIDGGMLVVRSKEELEMIHEMRLVGMGQPASVMYQNERAWTYDVKRLGFRYHMANLHAALGLAQLSKIATISETRRSACRYYNDKLKGSAQVRLPDTNFEDATPFLYYIRVPEAKRQAFRAHMQEQGIDTGLHWQPGHWFTLFQECRRGDLTVTDHVGKQIVSLPLHSSMHADTLKRIVEGVRTFFEN
jgi:dTDP-4-amino-4,6-dideoxygalactose transaminase